MDVSPWQFKTGPSVWCLYSTNTRHKADQNPLDTMGLYWMVLASAETWSAQIKYLEPKWPLFLKVNPAKQGLFKPKLGSFGFQGTHGFLLSDSLILSQQLDSHSWKENFSSKPSFQGSCWFSFRVYLLSLFALLTRKTSWKSKRHTWLIWSPWSPTRTGWPWYGLVVEIFY